MGRRNVIVTVVMHIINQFCSVEELEQLKTLWRSITGWSARDAYQFAPCMKPPPILLERALACLPIESKAPYTDSFFLHYVEGKGLDVHTDERSAKRLNVLVTRPDEGGMFRVADQFVPLGVGDAIVFDPSKEPHSVTPITRGERLVWSVGRTKNVIRAVKVLTRKDKRQ